MFDKQELLKHVKKPEEKLWFAKALEQAYYCMKNYEPCFTDFSDPLKIGELINLIGKKHEFAAMAFGGFEGSERLMAGFFPDFCEPSEDSFPIKAVEIKYNEKFSKKLAHRDFLGSILGLGLSRDKIGDILIFEGFAIAMVSDDIADYICHNLEKVSHTAVDARIVDAKEIEFLKPKADEKTIIVSSLRLDSVLSGAFNLSRGKIADYIAAEKAFVNWRSESSASKNVSAGDVITLRGVGRIKINEISGKTKKDRIVVNILKFT